MNTDVIILKDVDAVKTFLKQSDEDSIQEVIFIQGEVNNGESE